AMFAGPASPRGVHADLLERAGDNPFYAEEFARMVLDGRGDRGLPGSVQGLIAARLDGLALDEKELLQNAAVVGRVFWIGPLGDDRPRLEAALHALARREFVAPHVGGDLRSRPRYALAGGQGLLARLSGHPSRTCQLSNSRMVLPFGTTMLGHV
ncbi:MAG TPA: hypothetical protein VGW74_19450, partial [Propionibacteriaceae bacterium]|nr:hypothetical protein [Propionibacteriaceae bacterium]